MKTLRTLVFFGYAIYWAYSMGGIMQVLYPRERPNRFLVKKCIDLTAATYQFVKENMNKTETK